jgi:hypothetical protein
MRDIETKISPLIQSMFPSFYQEEGDNFIAFVKAYYEWLEENHQLLQLEDNTNFNVGDTIRQENVTGTIIAYIGTDIMVRVDGLETFKCFNVCSELIPVTSSSGGNTYIRRGGTTRRVGPLFFSRNLFSIRDIDKTLDLFIVRFKEKYLKNIEFDVQSNKQLLIKNALDLYRGKGTERAIDLFFRLVYGVNTQVYFPGEDLFRLSDGIWTKPQYIEIAVSNVDRAIDLVGKQVTGAQTGATAFVEKYIKRRIKDGTVHILYVSAIKGTFTNREALFTDRIYKDSPSIVGSLTNVEIITGSRLFEVGDTVSFNSVRGDYGLARVASVSDTTGAVDFLLIDGGWGYSISDDANLSEAELAQRSQSIVSEKVLSLENVRTSNSVQSFLVYDGGTGYNNTDIVSIQSPYVDATGKPTTNSTGGILSITLTQPGSGYYVDVAANSSLTIANSTGGATAGAGANAVAIMRTPTDYFKYFETFTERLATVGYVSASNSALFTPGESVYIGNSTVNTAFGVILSNANNALEYGNGSLVIAISNNGVIGTGNSIILISNSSVNAIANSITGSVTYADAANSAAFGAGNSVNIGNSTTTYATGVIVSNSPSNTSYGTLVLNITTGTYTVGNSVILASNSSVSAEIISGIPDTSAYGTVMGRPNSGTILVSAVVGDTISIQDEVYQVNASGIETFAGTVLEPKITGASGSIDIDNFTGVVNYNLPLLVRSKNTTATVNNVLLTVGLYEIRNNYLNEYSPPVFSLTSGTTANLVSVSQGFGASFRVGEIGETETLYLNIDVLGSNNSPVTGANQAYMSLPILALAYGFPKKPLGNNETVINQCLSYDNFTIGTIGQLTSINPGADYNVDSYVLVQQPFISGYNRKDYIITIRDTLGSFIPGEKFLQTTLQEIFYNVTVSDVTTFATANSVNERVYQANSSTYADITNVERTNSVVTITTNSAHGYGTSNSVLIKAVSNPSVNGIFTITTVVNSTAFSYDQPGANIASTPDTGNSVLLLTSGLISEIQETADILVISGAPKPFVNSVVVELYSNSAVNSLVTDVELDAVGYTAKAIVKEANSTVISAKRIQFGNQFVVGQRISGLTSLAEAYIVSVEEDQSSLPIGFNALVEANVVTANGTVTSLEIIDSGIGYANGEIMLFTSEDGERSGQAKAVVQGLGTGAGYYKTSKGFLSSISKVHDGDFYQEYSYEILSRIPFDKYASMFKKVMHTSGTRFFGGVLLESTADVDINTSDVDLVQTLASTLQFNSNSSVVDGTILGNNAYTNGSLIINNGEKVEYKAFDGNSAIIPLSNGAYYWATSANSTSLKLATNPRTLAYTFNSNSSVSANSISMRHNFVDGDFVQYIVSAGNSAITGISNGETYYVVNSTANTVKLSLTSGGSVIGLTKTSNDENGHTLQITTINIVANSTASGAVTNGHILTVANET